MTPERTSGDFGRKLREARERRGISLREIANATKISIAALESLERNDISRLPGGIFSRAFVRSYAVEVGLDPEATIQEFVTQFPNDSVTAGHRTDHVEDEEAVESDRRMASTFLGLIAVSVPIAAAVLYFGVTGRRPAPAPPSDASVATPDPFRLPEPSTVPSAPPISETRPAVAALPEVATSPRATAAEERPAPSPSAPAAAAPPVAPPPADEAGDRLTVGLSATRPVWISATVDGRKAIERLLQPGEQRTIEVRREFVLTAGDASAINMTLNGAEAKPLGRNGEVVTTRVNLANFKGYLQNR